MYFRYVTNIINDKDKPPLPTRATKDSAAYDLYAADTYTLKPNSYPILIRTGVKCYLPEDTFLQIQLRSSFPLKHLVIMPNSPGIIDRDYVDNSKNEGEIFIQLLNLSQEDIIIEKGTRLAQGICIPCLAYETVTTTRNGGFGSTDGN